MSTSMVKVDRTKDCEHCGREFALTKKYLAQRYCSRVCGNAARARPAKPCSTCDQQFHPRKESAKFCSQVCSAKSKRRPTKACENCGTAFEPDKAKAKFCSKECCWKSWKVDRKPRVCEECHHTYDRAAAHDGNANRFCSTECYNTNRRQGRLLRLGWRAGRTYSVEVRQCKFCHEDFEVPPFLKQEYCSVQCGQDARYAAAGELIPLEPEKFMGLLRWAVAQHTRHRPIDETDEYQSAYLALLQACRTYRGKQEAETFVIYRMRKQIMEDKHGRLAVRRATRGVQFVSIDREVQSMSQDGWHPPAKEPDPLNAAIGQELQEARRH